jgi:hypothetical protein
MLAIIIQGQKIMGITVEEYLKDRQACSVCEGEGNEEYCVTHMLSRPDNCMIYNSVNYNSDPKDNADILLLQNLRATPGAERLVLEYYLRAEPIVKKIKELHGEDVTTWDMYYQTYVSGIIKALRDGNNQSAIDQIFVMLTDLESKELT